MINPEQYKKLINRAARMYVKRSFKTRIYIGDISTLISSKYGLDWGDVHWDLWKEFDIEFNKYVMGNDHAKMEMGRTGG